MGYSVYTIRQYGEKKNQWIIDTEMLTRGRFFQRLQFIGAGNTWGKWSGSAFLGHATERQVNHMNLLTSLWALEYWRP